MASSRPVVVTNCIEMAKVVENEKCGIVCNQSISSLYNALEFLLSNISKAEEMGINGREAIKQRHSWVNRARIIRKQFKD